MAINSLAISRNTKVSMILALFFAFIVAHSVAVAGEYFDKDDKKGLEHLSGALMAWYETNQLGQPKSDNDMERVFSLLNRVYTECKKVPDKTLKKIDSEFATQFRDNLQEGAHQYEIGFKAYWKASKKGNEPTAKEKSDMNNGQQKMLHFHKYYNANIERIARDLKKKGVDLFG